MGYTILLVDDSETIRCMLERALGMTRLPLDSVVQVSDGLEALERLKTQWFDIVFTDINMPRMSGIELIDAMNRDAAMADIPVVVVSTEGSSARIEALKSKGVRGYLRKPFTPEKLRDVIVETLGDWHG